MPTSILVFGITFLAGIDPPFPLRTDPTPKEWHLDRINDGLPYRWEKGTVHVLAWEVVEDDRPWKYTQALVLKRFDQPTEKGGNVWLLAHLYHHPDDRQWPWRASMRIPPPYPVGAKTPKYSDAQLYGHEFYKQLPTDRQVAAFLRESNWRPTLGPGEVFSASPGKRVITTTLTAGGVDPATWRKLFGRDLPADLFPELTRATSTKP